MTYPRVNLLKKSEQRYQGTVSRSFILLSAIGVPVLVILLVIGISAVNSVGIKSQISSNQMLWENLEPRLKQYKKENAGLATSSKVLDLFKGWKSSCISFVDLLDEVQDTVPETVQFSRLSIRSGAAKPLYKTAKELEMDYQLTIDGIAFGTEAEHQVIGLQKDLIECENVADAFSSVKLASMRNRKTSDGVSARDFKLLGVSKKGTVK